jgi:hypothetical protein
MCTFGIFKQRFRFLKNAINLLHFQDDIDNVFFTCCILHNMILMFDSTTLDPRWENNVIWENLTPPEQPFDNDDEEEGEEEDEASDNQNEAATVLNSSNNNNNNNNNDNIALLGISIHRAQENLVFTFPSVTTTANNNINISSSSSSNNNNNNI